MLWIFNFLGLYAIAIPGWLFFRFIKMPASVMLGAMVASGLFSVKGYWVPEVPTGASLLFQIILGIYVGIRLNKAMVQEFKSRIGLAFFSSFWWISFPMGLGLLISQVFGIDIGTCILGTVPGGVAEMSVFAIAMNADAAMVALMQFFRVLGSLVAIPIISTKLNKYFSYQVIKNSEVYQKENNRPGLDNNFKIFKTCFTVSLAAIGGIMFYKIGIPVGGFVGSMFFTAVASIAGFSLKPPPTYFRNITQLGLGAVIGLRATPETIILLKGMFFAILGSTVIMIFWGMILAFIVKKFSKWDLITCLLATSPAGVTQLAAVAEELGADSAKVSFLQLVRLFTALLVIPPMIKALL